MWWGGCLTPYDSFCASSAKGEPETDADQVSPTRQIAQHAAAESTMHRAECTRRSWKGLCAASMHLRAGSSSMRAECPFIASVAAGSAT